MFASIRRFRRQLAVLTALSLLASVLVAVPAVAADDDPKRDYEATFSACVDVPASGFEDVPSNHSNAGDIDCIAYYGVTKGTSATTYSPLMSVSREHMALFLTRLAGLVGIDVAADPADAGFTDIGDLSAESQTAVNQLADLGVTQGTSDTTYSPGDVVKRGHMALFISRLMDLMDPMAEDDDTVFGYTPEDVVDNDMDDDDASNDIVVKSPFTDISGQTKEAYDAITNLWELGVASGISATSYAPDASITRAAMAEFMAGVLDHSNARPAGVSIQASKTSGFDVIEATVAVSYRDDNFAPMVDVSIKTFHNNTDGDGVAGVGEFTEDGGCSPASACAWTDDETLTDDGGNIFFEGSAPDGKTNTYYAWMGDEDNADFNVNESAHGSVTLSSTTDAVNLKVTTSISSNSTGGNTVDIDATSSVTHTVQLVDSTGAAVAKSGVEISVEWVQTPTGGSAVTVYPAPAPLETDGDGQATFISSGPKSTKGNTDTGRVDTVTFTADVNEDDTTADLQTGADPDETVVVTVNWSDDDAAITSGKGSAPSYVIRDSKNEVAVRASVTFYDQYGNTIGKGFVVDINIGAQGAETRTVSSRGVATWREVIEVVDADLGNDITIVYDSVQGLPDASNVRPSLSPTITGGASVEVVDHADDDSAAAAANIDAIYADDNRFLIGNDLYTYDSDDVFVDTDGSLIDLDKFEGQLGANLDSIGTVAQVQIVSYDDDGSSIFRVALAAMP